MNLTILQSPLFLILNTDEGKGNGIKKIQARGHSNGNGINHPHHLRWRAVLRRSRKWVD